MDTNGFLLQDKHTFCGIQQVTDAGIHRL